MHYVALNRCTTPHHTTWVTLRLTRFQRVLLGTDGTVTRILEAFAGEAMEVVKLLQVFDTSNEGDAELTVPGADVLRRWVLLRGRDSGQTLLYAEAVVVLARVDPAIVEGLQRTDKPIGVLLAESRTETFREILRIDQEPAGDKAAHFEIAPTDDLLWRTYRVIAGRRPVMTITEKFPAAFFRSLPA